MFYTFVIPTENLEHSFSSGYFAPLNKYFSFRQVLQAVINSSENQLIGDLLNTNMTAHFEKSYVLELSLQNFVDRFCEAVAFVIGTEYYTYEFVNFVYEGFAIIVSYSPDFAFNLNNDKLSMKMW